MPEVASSDSTREEVTVVFEVIAQMQRGERGEFARALAEAYVTRERTSSIVRGQVRSAMESYVCANTNLNYDTVEKGLLP